MASLKLVNTVGETLRIYRMQDIVMVHDVFTGEDDDKQNHASIFLYTLTHGDPGRSNPVRDGWQIKMSARELVKLIKRQLGAPQGWLKVPLPYASSDTAVMYYNVDHIVSIAPAVFYEQVDGADDIKRPGTYIDTTYELRTVTHDISPADLDRQIEKIKKRIEQRDQGAEDDVDEETDAE